MPRGSVGRLPLWAYGALAGLLVVLAIAWWTRADVLLRTELVIPAAFWSAAFIVIGLQRRAARS